MDPIPSELDDLMDAYLAGTLAPADAARLAARLRSDPAAGDALARHVRETVLMVQVAAQLGACGGDEASAVRRAVTDGAHPRGGRPRSAVRRAFRSRAVPFARLAVAAALLVACVAAWRWGGGLGSSGPSPAPVPTADGRPVARGALVAAADRPVRLEMGGYCRVRLEPGGAVRVEGSAGAEQVRLERGQVACEVKPGAGTFAVRAAAGAARVLGTRFEARLAENGALAVSVSEGAVQLSGPSAERLVSAGESAQIAPGEDTRLERTKGYLLDWLIAGPYRVEGMEAHAIFDVVFPPEFPGLAPEGWRRIAAGVGAWDLDLKAAVADAEDVAAYLKTRLCSPAEQDVLLELGSDDAVKVWLNGTLVHGNNADRAIEPRQDMAAVRLRTGWNDILFKVTNHRGPWAVGCRVCRPDGAAMTGLHVDAR
jgi:ferric-dicitrate binding protein FerR (iron transport regulator)